MNDTIRPFVLDIPQSELERLYHKIDAARWPEAEPVDDWSQGTPLCQLRELVEYWRSGYNWRGCEAYLNSLGQFVTEIDGLDIHFLHVRSPHENALPIVLTHGWPGSVVEFLGVIERLTQPEKYGGTAADAFHVIAPSLPGFGFSGKPTSTGWGIEKIARAWATLVARLGYDHWVAQGGDWGSAVTAEIGRQAPEGCRAIHVNMVSVKPTAEDFSSEDADMKKALAGLKYYADWDSGYSKQQSTRPQTIGYALVDSPIGLAGWVYEKMYAWTDNKGSPLDALRMDAILDNLMLYWLPATGASAARLYWESFGRFAGGPVRLPGGVSAFPGEIMPAPRAWAERLLPNLIYWNTLDKGGHFAAWEQPEMFTREIRACFAKIR